MTIAPHREGLEALYTNFGPWFEEVSRYNERSDRSRILSVMYFAAEFVDGQTSGVQPALDFALAHELGNDRILEWQLLCVKFSDHMILTLDEQRGTNAAIYRLKLNAVLVQLFDEIKFSVKVGAKKGLFWSSPVVVDYRLPEVQGLESFVLECLRTRPKTDFL